MSRDVIRATLQAILRDVLENDSLIITDETVADDVEDWDSANHVRVFLAIEKDFQIHFDMDEVDRPDTVGGLVDLIERKLSAQLK